MNSTADRIMEYIPEHRVKDVIYFAPFDAENPISFNVMEDIGADKRHLVVNGLMSAFKPLTKTFDAAPPAISAGEGKFPDATDLPMPLRKSPIPEAPPPPPEPPPGLPPVLGAPGR